MVSFKPRVTKAGKKMAYLVLANDNRIVSAIPVDLRYSTALPTTPRGSRLYGELSTGL